MPLTFDIPSKKTISYNLKTIRNHYKTPRDFDVMLNPAFSGNACDSRRRNGDLWGRRLRYETERAIEGFFRPSKLSIERISLYLDQHQSELNFKEDAFSVVLFVELGRVFVYCRRLQDVRDELYYRLPDTKYAPLSPARLAPVLAAEEVIHARERDLRKVNGQKRTEEDWQDRADCLEESLELLEVDFDAMLCWAEDRLTLRSGRKKRVFGLADYGSMELCVIGAFICWRSEQTSVLADNQRHGQKRIKLWRNWSHALLTHMLEGRIEYDEDLGVTYSPIAPDMSFIIGGDSRELLIRLIRHVGEVFNVTEFESQIQLVMGEKPYDDMERRREVADEIFAEVVDSEIYAGGMTRLVKAVRYAIKSLRAASERQEEGLRRYWSDDEERILSRYLASVNGAIDWAYLDSLLPTRNLGAIRRRIDVRPDRIYDIIVQEGYGPEGEGTDSEDE